LLSRFSSPASHSFTRILNFSILFNLYDLFECDISLIDFVQFPVWIRVSLLWFVWIWYQLNWFCSISSLK
jgi:hypothetical protein